MPCHVEKIRISTIHYTLIWLILWSSLQMGLTGGESFYKVDDSNDSWDINAEQICQTCLKSDWNKFVDIAIGNRTNSICRCAYAELSYQAVSTLAQLGEWQTVLYYTGMYLDLFIPICFPFIHNSAMTDYRGSIESNYHIKYYSCYRHTDCIIY